jgi:hypothetical protein
MELLRSVIPDLILCDFLTLLDQPAFLATARFKDCMLDVVVFNLPLSL